MKMCEKSVHNKKKKTFRKPIKTNALGHFERFQESLFPWKQSVKK